jgi:imidazolonepropionase-like amidohydrolase
MRKTLFEVLIIVSMKFKSAFASIVVFGIAFAASAQLITLKGGTVHIGNGKVLENAVVSFNNGTITIVESNPQFKTDETLGQIIDCKGKHIYPSLIAMNTYLGLSEVESVRASNDHYETGSFNPNVRSIIAYNTDSKVIGTVRSNGVLYAQIAPHGGRVSGSSSVVKLDGWNWEDAAEKQDDGVWISWPQMYNRKGWWANPQGIELNKDYDKQIQELKDFFREAASYHYAEKHDKKNLRFEAMRGLFEKEKNVFVRASHVKEMQHAIAFSEELQVKLVLVGAEDSWRIADELASKKIPVVLNRLHELPMNDDDDVNSIYKTPTILQKAGVVFALSMPGFWQVRNLPFVAGSAAAYGLDKEAALQSITATPAAILSLNNVGTIAVGNKASLFVSKGDVLDMRTSIITKAFLNGKEIDLSNKQTELQDKYKHKYGVK